jgi:hypothetical protein
MALGYHRVIWLHVNCVEHGLYRIELSAEQEFYLCPVCQQACSASILFEGLTRRELLFEPVQIVKGLSSKAREWLLVEPRIAKPPDRRERRRYVISSRRATATA